MKTASYTKTPQGDGFLFNVTPAPKTNGGCAGMYLYILLAALCAFMVGGFIASSANRYDSTPATIGTIVGLVIFILIIRWAFKRDTRPKNHRNPSFFTVYPDRIEMNGQKMSRENIHRLIVVNAFDSSTILIGRPSMSQSAGLQLREMTEQISYGLNIEAGGKAYQLAGGMDNVTANGLLTDVSRILGFS